jgi:hypothetical protein
VRFADKKKIPSLLTCFSWRTAHHETMKFLTVGTPGKINVFLWAPKPYYKFMGFKEFDINRALPLKLNLTLTSEDSMQVSYGTPAGFHNLDVSSGHIVDIFVPSGKAREEFKPIAIVRMPAEQDSELLLLYNDMAVVVDRFGDVVKEVNLKWESVPSTIGIMLSFVWVFSKL